ncbi:MAG TPA: SGNH/GDSL hydrolase family protein [Usitatibacter sp.]|nr:SGNH/GDSL hydrolase family protein [Usitatibacter sp.]
MLPKAPKAGRSLLAALLLFPLLALAQVPSPHFVIFGDSLSDSGNVFVVGNVGFDEGANNVPPDYNFDPGLNPNAAYARGGHHITNGATWIEVLTKRLGYGVNGNPAFASDNPLATNYAVAGARAHDRTDEGAIDLPDEVGAFLADFGAGNAPPDALYVIEVGANDIFDAARTGDPTLAVEALQSIGDNIVALYGNGARRFLVVGVPNLGLTPIAQGDPIAAATASGGFNLMLQALVLQPLGALLPGVDIRFFDLYAAVNDVVANAETYGLTVLDTPCVTPEAPPFVCRNPDEYMFWDGIHPTRAVHAIIAGKAAAFLAP